MTVNNMPSWWKWDTFDAFYKSTEWREARLKACRLAHWRCSGCFILVNKKGQSRVDHIEKLRENPHRAFDQGNLRVFCPTCDNQRHMEKGMKKLDVPAVDITGAVPGSGWS